MCTCSCGGVSNLQSPFCVPKFIRRHSIRETNVDKLTYSCPKCEEPNVLSSLLLGPPKSLVSPCITPLIVPYITRLRSLDPKPLTLCYTPLYNPPSRSLDYSSYRFTRCFLSEILGPWDAELPLWAPVPTQYVGWVG